MSCICYFDSRSGSKNGFNSCAFYLGADASVQGGRDWFIIQEDVASLKQPEVFTTYNDAVARMMFDSDDSGFPGNLPLLNNHIERRLMPMLIIGSGRAGVAQKLHKLLHAIKLEARQH